MEIIKDGELVATSSGLAQIELTGDRLVWTPLPVYFFQRVTLDRIATFSHFSGVALTAFFDGCYVKDADKEYGPLNYVHGISEVLRGKQSVHSVLLADFSCKSTIRPDLWKYLPEIYKVFLVAYNKPQQIT